MSTDHIQIPTVPRRGAAADLSISNEDLYAGEIISLEDEEGLAIADKDGKGSDQAYQRIDGYANEPKAILYDCPDANFPGADPDAASFPFAGEIYVVELTGINGGPNKGLLLLNPGDMTSAYMNFEAKAGGILDVSRMRGFTSLNNFMQPLREVRASRCRDINNCQSNNNALLEVLDISFCRRLLTAMVTDSPVLATVRVTGCRALQELTLTHSAAMPLTQIEGIETCDNLEKLHVGPAPAMVSLPFSSARMTNLLAACALPAAEVDRILVQMDANKAGLSPGTISLDNSAGSANEPPSATGLAAKASLEAAGWTVSVAS